MLTEDGWYISGDVFRRDADGAYYFVGRADDMFVCGGENIYPAEVETVLESHPEIVQACVVPVPDEFKGEKPVAYVVRADGAALGEDEIKQYALARAPAYLHPRMVMFADAFAPGRAGQDRPQHVGDRSAAAVGRAIANRQGRKMIIERPRQGTG